MQKRIIAAASALLMVLVSICSVLPAFAKEEKPGIMYEAPEGFDEHDYQKMAAFLEQADENGVANGAKLNPDYDPQDPASWPSVEWRDSRIYRFDANYKGLVGTLDLSGCTGITSIECIGNALTKVDVSGCTVLNYLSFDDNAVTEVNVSGCTSIERLFCSENRLSELDVSDCSEALFIQCYNNSITELDVSACTKLIGLVCYGNLITELDLSNNAKLGFDMITAEGNGTIGVTHYWDDVKKGEVTAAIAQPSEGAQFLGWYSDDGVFISMALRLADKYTAYKSIVARFTASEPEPSLLPGDCDRNGIVDTTDALLVLRCALNISGNADEIIVNCDIDENGVIDTTDALLILRIALDIH